MFHPSLANKPMSVSLSAYEKSGFPYCGNEPAGRLGGLRLVHAALESFPQPPPRDENYHGGPNAMLLKYDANHDGTSRAMN